MNTQTTSQTSILPKLSFVEKLLAKTPKDEAAIQIYKIRYPSETIGFSVLSATGAWVPTATMLRKEHYDVKLSRFGFVKSTAETKLAAVFTGLIIGGLTYGATYLGAFLPAKFKEVSQFQVPAMTVDLNSEYKATAMIDRHGQKVVFVNPIENKNDTTDFLNHKPGVRLGYNPHSLTELSAEMYFPEKNPGLKDYASVSRIDELYAKVFTNPNRRPAKN